MRRTLFLILVLLAGCTRVQQPQGEKNNALFGTKWTASTDYENRQYVLYFASNTEVSTYIADNNMNKVGTEYGEGTYALEGNQVTFDLTFVDGFTYKYLDASIKGDMMTLRKEWITSSGDSIIFTQEYTKK